MTTTIQLRYSAVDGYTEKRTFSTIAGAQRYAHKAIGAHPEIGSMYAVSGDGIGKIVILRTGKFYPFTLAELFPSNEPVSQPRGYRSYEQMQGDCGQDWDDENETHAADRAYLAAPKVELNSNGLPLHRTLGCTCSVTQLERVGCDCELTNKMPSCPGLPLDM